MFANAVHANIFGTQVIVVAADRDMATFSVCTEILRAGVAVIHFANSFENTVAIEAGVEGAEALIVADGVFIVANAAKTKINGARNAVVGIAYGDKLATAIYA
jgi:hypothetical protein